MATKKKNQLNIIGEAVLDENDKVVSKKAFIQPSKEIAPVKKTDGFFKSSDAADNWSLSTGNPMLDFIQRTNAGIWGTVFNAGTNVVRGATSSIEGVGDFAQNRVADIQDLFGFDKAAEKTRRKSEETWGVNKKIDEFNDIMNTTSILGDKSEGVFQGVGSSLLAMGTAGLGGAVSGGSQLISSIASLGTLGIGAAGSSENEARMQMMNEMKDKGYTTKQINDAARMYGLFSGTAETLSEMMFGGISKASKALGIGKGLFDSADDAVINTLTKNIQGKIVKNLVQAGLKASGEGVEEVASGLMDAFAKKLTYMKDEKLIDLIKDENLLDSFISGTLSAYITQAPSAFKSVTTRQDGKLRLQTNEEIRDFITNLNEQEQKVVNREIENRIGQEEKVSKKRRIEIEKQVIEDLDRGYISANTIRDVLGENYNAERDVRLNESFNEEARRTQAYENDLSKYDEKQRKTIQTAIDSGLLNNSNKTHDFVDLIAKLSADKGVEFDFTNNENLKNSGFAVQGKTVNGFVQDGKITLNLESNQALNKVVGHEITHVLEGTELYNSLQDSLKSFIGEREWNNRISELEKTYKDVKGANIENELTSDLVGEYVFNDESFVKSLSTRNPNLFQKIFDEIKYMVKIATAGSKEARDLEKVKRAFEKAYRETSKTQQGTQYQLDNQDNLIDVTNETTGYENVPNKLLGFSSSIAEQKGFNETKYPYTLDLQISVDGGKTYFEDSIKGMNRKQAIERAKRNWGKDAILKETSKIQEGTRYSINQLTDDGITMTYVRNPNSNAQQYQEQYKNVGLDFGQDIEPSGEYMSMDTMEGKNKIDGYEYGTIQFKNPLVIDNEDTTSKGWKKDLSNMYNGLTGKELSNAIMQDGYDAVMSRDNEGNIVEVVNLKGTKQNNQNTKYSLTDNQGRELSEQQQEYFKDSKLRNENGELEVVYHTSPNQFTVFDNTKLGENTEYSNTAFGFFVTPNKNFSQRFGDINQEGTKGNTMEMYANITNPITHPFYAGYKYEGEQLDNIVRDYMKATGNEQFISDLEASADEEGLSLYQTYMDMMLGEDPFETADFDREELIKNGYDAVEFVEGLDKDVNYNVSDSKEPVSSYAVFDSNQLKNVDNTNPTTNEDIRYQLGTGEIAPSEGYDVRGRDIALEGAIAPLQEQVQQLTDTITRLEDRIAPLNEQEADELYQETQRGFENEVAPIRNNLTPEENQRMDMLELLERNGMLNEERRYEKEQLENKINPVYPTEEATPGQALSDIRDIDEVGKRDVKAYQYEHPEVKPYFQQEARGMLSDLNNSQKGERFKVTSNAYDGHIIEQEEWKGVPRFTSPQIAELLDSKWGYTYKDIEKGLKAIIEDHGAENIAVAKRIEFILDDNLRNGYTDWQTGMEVPPNQDYLNMLKEQEWQNYFDDINNQYPLEQNIPQYDLENDFSDVRIEPDIQDMTEDDLNLEPFLQGLVKADERQKARQEMDKKVVNRNEYTPKKKGLIGKAIDLYKSATNEFAVVDKFAKDVKNPTITHKIDTWNNYVPLAQTNITTAQTDINGNAIGRSVDSIWSEADKLGVREILDEYLKHWSNVDRGKRGKGALDYSAKESYKKVQEIKEQHPEVHRLAKDCWQLYRNARHNLVDAGTISQQQSDAIGRANPHYNPFISENLNAYFTETGELKPRKTIKSAKGGAELEGLLSSEEAMKKYMYSQFAETTGNDAFLEIVKSSPDQFIYGGDDRTSYVNQDHLSVDKDGYYLTAYENGEPVTARISKEMYDSLSRQTKHRVDEFVNKYESILKPLEKFGNLRRKMLTELSPSFLLKNPGKDFQEAVINSKYTKDMIANYMNPQTWIELAKGTGEASQFRNLYGSGLVMGQYDIDISKIDPKSKNFNFLKKLGNANEYMELITRYAEFKASRQNGASIQEAMYNAREVTTNFSRGNPIVKAFNKYGMTFLNSSVQGFDKFIRNFSGENGAKGVVNSLAKAAIFGIAPAVFNELVFGSGDDKDEEYEALPDYIKDNYYIIKTGNGNFIRIPKGRVLSVFGSAARRTLELAQGEENAFEGFSDNVWQQIGINNPEENNIFAPLLQAMGGRKLDSGQTAGSAWYGGDIIPSRLQKERPEDQYDASIDDFSIWLGQRTGISPYKINYVLDQYTGGIGDLALPMITKEANSDADNVLEFISSGIKDQFKVDTITDNKYVSEFYDTKGKLYTGSKATDEDILKNKYMNSISTEMAKLYAERREVQADDSLTKKQKYAKSQEIKAEINRLAKEGMDNYNNVIMSNNYAKIGDTDYYKNANGQWTKVTDDVASLGLDTEEKNEYYKVKNDIYTTKKENDGNDKPLVMQDIINSNLTPDAKVNLYTSNYKDDLIQPLVDSGMDVDSYLTYKSQNFTADKDSNGKSISGSKKRKVFDYINSMNIPYQQKLILAKSEYNTFNDNNTEIIEYIENSGMDYDERISLYKQLGFKVDGNNVSW